MRNKAKCYEEVGDSMAPAMNLGLRSNDLIF